MITPLRELFDFARRSIRPEDIERYCVSVPGRDKYVMAFTRLWESGPPASPEEVTVELWCSLDDTVNAGNWWREKQIGAELETEQTRFRRFRVFANSACLVAPEGFRYDLVQLSHVLHGLIRDAIALEDRELTRKTQAGLTDLPSVLDTRLGEQQDHDDAAFIPIALLILSTLPDAESVDVAVLVEQLRAADARARRAYVHCDDGLLWGITFNDVMNFDWAELIDSHLTRIDHPAVQSLVTELQIAA